MTIEEIFSEAAVAEASDIHLAHNLPVFFRIDGDLIEIKKWPVLDHQAILQLIEPIINPEQKERLFKKKNLDFSFQIKEGVRFRVNLFWERGSLALAARLIQLKIPAMEEINMPKVAYKLTELKDGLILVTGPTGCGKSTTLAAFINYISANRSCHIITLEDPIEYIFKQQKGIIVQRELGQDMLSFESALKHIVRQDPNVVLVGEMRDLETVRLAITLAETGHLILATLHTPNAPQAVDRIIDIFPAYQQTQVRLQLALVLRAVISQHLLPKVNGGRIAAREILINTSATANLIRENKVAQLRTVMQTGAKDGMCILEQDLKLFYRKNLITLDTALAHATYPEDILKD